MSAIVGCGNFSHAVNAVVQPDIHAADIFRLPEKKCQHIYRINADIKQGAAAHFRIKYVGDNPFFEVVISR